MTSQRLLAAKLIAGCAASFVLAAAGPALAQKKGGDVVVAQQAQPPTLDAMNTSAQAARNISFHMFETLVTRDEKASPIPDLAQKVDVSTDGLTYTFTLRQGVMFHNGKEMTSADAKCSLERYGKVGFSAYIMEPVAAVEAPDKYTVTVKMRRPSPGFIEQLSSPRAPAAVIPESECGKEAGKVELIGTGPFQFVEYKPDSHVKMKRFDGYTPNPNYKERDGFGGRKTAYFDTVTFRFMPEAGARTAALQTGEVQVLEQIGTPDAKRFEKDATLKMFPMVPWGMQTLIVNAAQAPTDNQKVREAMALALDNEEIMAIATDGLYALDHGWQYPGSDYDPGAIGKDKYNVKDVARAKALLKEAGYNGQEVVLLADTSFKNHNDTAVVASQQLKAIGMNAVVKVVDWPTAYNMALNQDKGWNTWALGMGIEPYEGPYNVIGFFYGKKAAMKITDPEIDKINDTLTSSLDLGTRKKAFADFQKRMYEQFYAIKVGDFGIYQAGRANVMNYKPYRIPRMWDVWFQ